MLEPGKTILLAVAAIGWLLASLIAFAIVALFGFFGVGLSGLFVWFTCTQSELHAEAGAGRRHVRSWPTQSTRFVKYVGIGLTLIGFGGFLYGLGAFAL